MISSKETDSLPDISNNLTWLLVWNIKVLIFAEWYGSSWQIYSTTSKV